MIEMRFWNIAKEQMGIAVMEPLLIIYSHLVGYELRYAYNSDLWVHKVIGQDAAFVEMTPKADRAVWRNLRNAARWLGTKEAGKIIGGAFAIPGATLYQQRKVAECEAYVIGEFERLHSSGQPIRFFCDLIIPEVPGVAVFDPVYHYHRCSVLSSKTEYSDAAPTVIWGEADYRLRLRALAEGTDAPWFKNPIVLEERQ